MPKLHQLAAYIFFISAAAGCSQDVGQRLQAIKIDQQYLEKQLNLSTQNTSSILAKSSAVSISTDYNGAESKTILENSIAVAESLDYKEKFINKNPKTLYFFCHKKEPGRSFVIARNQGSINVMFRVSGWSDDRRECPGG